MQAATELAVIEAAYIRNALNYARWPKGSYQDQKIPFRLAIAGNAEALKQSFDMAFNKLNYRIQDCSVQLLHFPSPATLAKEISVKGKGTCQALFIPKSEKVQLKEWIRVTKDLPILLISDEPDFIKTGGEVALVPNPQTPKRFYYIIHSKRLESKNLRFSLEFLRLRNPVKVISR